ncbi:MAG TPA: ABC transporter ATP-binding protein [Lachnospiraceae bacterium]|nr:ABC transporter ATP-binding protein [Lachnospiraceae bacterium]
MRETMIQIDNLKKKYKLGTIGGGTLRGEITAKIAKKRGKENPNGIVGVEHPENNKEFWALKGVSFTVKKGERVGIIGSNGAGKSTLLKIISRITAPTQGVVRLNGKITSMLEIGTGFHGELTGRENIYLNGSILGMKKAEINAVLNDIIAFSECEKFIDTPVKRYSSGMYVKLAFSVAAHLNSDIMIMDEVLAVGDVAFQRKCLDKMNEVSKNQGKTILYVSHNMSTIRRLCNRCIVLEKGNLTFDGNVEDAIQQYMKIGGELKLLNPVTESMRNKILNYDMNLRAQLLEIELLEPKTNYIEARQCFKFRATVQSNDNVSELFFRCIIYKMDGSPVGTAMSDGLYDFKRGEQRSVIMRFDSSQIAPGKYVMTVILFRPDYTGGSEKYDAVSNALLFEVVTTQNQYFNYEWMSGWGTASYPLLIEEC